MNSKTIIMTTVCTALLGASTVFADSKPLSQTIEVKEKKSYSSSQKPHPVFTWNSNFIPVTSVLHPSSARGAGMVDAPLQQIDSIMNKYISQKLFPGAVAFVARGGKIVKHTAYGNSAIYTDGEFTEMENPIAMRGNTIF